MSISKKKFRHDKNNEFLHNLLDIHYHKGIVYPNGSVSVYKCSCMDHQSIDPLWKLNTDLLSPIGFNIVMEFLIRKDPDLWNKYITWCYHYTSYLPAKDNIWIINGVELVKKVTDLSNLIKFIRLKNIFKNKQQTFPRKSRFIKEKNDRN